MDKQKQSKKQHRYTYVPYNLQNINKWKRLTKHNKTNNKKNKKLYIKQHQNQISNIKYQELTRKNNDTTTTTKTKTKTKIIIIMYDGMKYKIRNKNIK